MRRDLTEFHLPIPFTPDAGDVSKANLQVEAMSFGGVEGARVYLSVVMDPATRMIVSIATANPERNFSRLPGSFGRKNNHPWVDAQRATGSGKKLPRSPRCRRRICPACPAKGRP